MSFKQQLLKTGSLRENTIEKQIKDLATEKLYNIILPSSTTTT